MTKLNDDEYKELEDWILTLLTKSRRFGTTEKELANQIIARIREVFEKK